MNIAEMVQKQFEGLRETLEAQIREQVEEALGRQLNAEELKGLKKDVLNIKTALGRSGGTGGMAEVKTIGKMFRDHPDYKNLKGGISIKIELNEKDGDYRNILAKGLSNTSTDFPGLAPEFNRTDVVPIRRARPRLRDFMVVIPTATGEVYFQRESNVFELYTEVGSTANSGQKNIVVDDAGGFFIGQTIKIGSGVNEETHVLTGVNHTTETLTTTSNLANTHAADVRVVSELFAFTDEGEVKPQGKIITEDVQVTIKTLATGISPSKQILDDAPRLEATINVRLPDAIDRSEENQILNGDGSTGQLTGILNTAGISTQTWSNGTPGDTRADTFRRAIATIRALKYFADLILIHPDDAADVELEKDDTGQYLKMLVPGPNGTLLMWRLPVVEIDHLASGTALVGAFREGAEIYDRMTLEIEIFPQHSDYAARNLVYIRAERRMGLAVLAPNAFAKVTLDSAP